MFFKKRLRMKKDWRTGKDAAKNVANWDTYELIANLSALRVRDLLLNSFENRISEQVFYSCCNDIYEALDEN
jgi:hypothetical protein